MADISEDLIEKMAREMIHHGGGNPDLNVIPGEPRMFGTPVGAVYEVSLIDPVPMWTLYRASARTALELASKVLQ